MAFVFNDLMSLVTLAVSLEVTDHMWTKCSDSISPVDRVVLDHNISDKFHKRIIVVSSPL